MDSPIAIITSELFPLFGLDAPEICALACTCASARRRIYKCIALYPRVYAVKIGCTYTLYQQYYSVNLIKNGGVFVFYGGVIIPTCAITLHRLCLNKGSYLWFRVPSPPAASNRLHRHRQKNIRKMLKRHGAVPVTAANLFDNPGKYNHIVVISDELYHIDTDPLDILPKPFHEHVIAVQFRRQN